MLIPKLQDHAGITVQKITKILHSVCYKHFASYADIYCWHRTKINAPPPFYFSLSGLPSVAGAKQHCMCTVASIIKSTHPITEFACTLNSSLPLDHIWKCCCHRYS